MEARSRSGVSGELMKVRVSVPEMPGWNSFGALMA